MTKGTFIISLDFELHWGAAEKWDLKLKGKYFQNTRSTIPHILTLFESYKINATWATVGFLFAKNREQLMLFCPEERPSYKNSKLSYYDLIDNKDVGRDENDDPYHYAPSLISKIINTPGQELGTHTFAHYYCNEPGQTTAQFEADIKAAQRLSKENFNLELKSLVFPRNQFNSDYISIVKENGIKVVRSNPDIWFWKNKLRINPIARAVDTLIPISKQLSFSSTETNYNQNVLVLPASRFLRPYSEREKTLQSLKLNRIRNEMTYAAKHNRGYHLWWHPHNFGDFPEENIKYLRTILEHFRNLSDKYGFESKSMIQMY